MDRIGPIHTEHVGRQTGLRRQTFKHFRLWPSSGFVFPLFLSYAVVGPENSALKDLSPLSKCYPITSFPFELQDYSKLIEAYKP